MQLDSNVLTLDETVFPSFRQGFRFGGDMSGSSPSIVVEDTSTSVTPKIFFAECIGMFVRQLGGVVVFDCYLFECYLRPPPSFFLSSSLSFVACGRKILTGTTVCAHIPS